MIGDARTVVVRGMVLSGSNAADPPSAPYCHGQICEI
jgi:hypothetical protein